VFFSAWILEKPPRMMVSEHHAVKIVGELLDVKVRAKVPFAYRRARQVCHEIEPVLLLVDKLISYWTFAIVQLRRRRNEDTATLWDFSLGPCEPTFEERPQTRLTAKRLQGRTDDAVDEDLRAELNCSNLQGLLRPEMRKETAFRQVELFGKAADGQAFETHPACDLNGSAQDLLPGVFTPAHALRIARPFVLSNPKM
jgi:hypothetical protein